MSTYLPLISGKKVGVVANHASLVGEIHLVDTLVSRGVQVQAIFSPEHGFRGTADRGQHIDDEVDVMTGLPVRSLYGSNRKPGPEMLSDIEIMLFDLQDVGARYYTYLGTMHYVMEACTEQGIPVIILDRPNPNGFYVDGPVLDPEFSSFIGMHPVPIVHGMTAGEYARMIVGEGWLDSPDTCDLTVIPMQRWTHDSLYHLPVRPSPNLPDMASVYCYPTLCLFEGTPFSVGRGTTTPFTILGHPDLDTSLISFTPGPTPGASTPVLNGQLCYGWNFRDSVDKVLETKVIQVEWLLMAYAEYPDKKAFFSPVFDKLAGGSKLREQVEDRWDAKSIRRSWQEDLQAFRAVRKRYLLYEDAGSVNLK